MFAGSSHGTINYDSDHESQTSTGSSLQSWVSWFCSLSGHEYYAEVPEEFMDDDFNLTGLSALVPYYNEALEMILDLELEEEDDDDEDNDSDNNSTLPANDTHSIEPENDDGFWKEQPLQKRRTHADPGVIEPYAIMLYGLIHQRYILTRNGLRLMAERYAAGVFGSCPRVYCARCPVIPVGRYDEAGRESVKLYCPSCLDLYNPPSIYQNVDGAHFGTTSAHLMFQSYSELMPLARRHIYQPKIVGFRINERSRTGPRMQWLRMRPPEYTESNDPDDSDDDFDDMDQMYDEEKSEEEEDQISLSQTFEDTTDSMSQITGQLENWHVQDSGINSFLRRWI